MCVCRSEQSCARLTHRTVARAIFGASISPSPIVPLHSFTLFTLNGTNDPMHVLTCVTTGRMRAKRKPYTRLSLPRLHSYFFLLTAPPVPFTRLARSLARSIEPAYSSGCNPSSLRLATADNAPHRLPHLCTIAAQISRDILPPHLALRVSFSLALGLFVVD